LDHTVFDHLLGFYIRTGNAALTNSVVQNSWNNGIDIIGGSPSISNTTIINSHSYGMTISDNYSLYAIPHLVHNTISNSGENSIYTSTPYGIGWMEDNTLESVLVGPGSVFNPYSPGASIYWNENPNAHYPYILGGSLTVLAGETLKLAPGVEVQINNPYYQLQVYGTLDAVGQPGQEITFRGAELSHGGSIQLLQGSKATLDYTLFGHLGGVGPSLYIESDLVTLTNSSIQNSIFDGIWVTNAHPNITRDNIAGNAPYGLFNSGSDTVIAECNWWGDPNGPYHPTLNPYSFGDEVSDNVSFYPWLTSPAPSPCRINIHLPLILLNQ
jgi:hypothetical protein